jgi:hypothetical protein
MCISYPMRTCSHAIDYKTSCLSSSTLLFDSGAFSGNAIILLLPSSSTADVFCSEVGSQCTSTESVWHGVSIHRHGPQCLHLEACPPNCSLHTCATEGAITPPDQFQGSGNTLINETPPKPPAFSAVRGPIGHFDSLAPSKRNEIDQARY